MPFGYNITTEVHFKVKIQLKNSMLEKYAAHCDHSDVPITQQNYANTIKLNNHHKDEFTNVMILASRALAALIHETI